MGRVIAIWFTVMAALLTHLSLAAQSGNGDLTLMWYNVENLFHPSDDSIAGDDEFTPGGVRSWSHERYRKKITGIARVIIAAGGWNPPDLVGLGEVENAMVLEDLVGHPILKPFGYRWLHRESADHRGIDVACLYREGSFRLAGWRNIPPLSHGDMSRTRDMLHIRGSWRGDSLDLFLVHFISRYRGSGATAVYRRMQSAHLAELAAGCYRDSLRQLVVLGGDFNDPWGSYALEPLCENRSSGVAFRPVSPKGPWCSYKYQGKWSCIDQFVVIGREGRWEISLRVLRNPALLVPDETYGGEKPFRTYSGYSYAGGYSDHLPILLDISRPFFLRSSGR